ncbi:Glycosyltransferase family 32 protein [Mycena kentingensis (nom. inval.)]|nr:Glycosyltransferase family 32 protein [Mycena kentingensis (nom. inval.)]
MVDLDADVFSCILSHIFDAATVRFVAGAIPKKHPFFAAAYEHAAVASEALLDSLLHAEEDREPLARHLRHLVVHLEHSTLDHVPPQRRPGAPPRPDRIPPDSIYTLQQRVAQLLEATANLRSFDYHGYPGLPLDATFLEPLGRLTLLESFSTDCARCNGEAGIPAGGGDYAAPGDLAAEHDVDNWDIDAFPFATLGPTLTSLTLRHINYTMFGVLKSKIEEFKTFASLRTLKLDITEGVWDWGGGGSPAMGASSQFEFPFLGFPSVIERFELVVCDKTLSSARLGALQMINYRQLTELWLDVRYSVWWMAYNDIRLFEAQLAMSALRLLEIKDNTRNTNRHYWRSEDDPARWAHPGRTYHGLVPFLSSGALPNLTHLWVDERVLLPDNMTLRDNVVWQEHCRTILEQVTSLRVGFGRLLAADLQVLVGLCNPRKLTQLGFEWNWHAYGQDAPFDASPLSQLPLLTDLHILFPRPHTEHAVFIASDPRTVADVAAIFASNPSIRRVGIANSVVWENRVLICNGRGGAHPNVSRFFHAGYMLNGEDRELSSDNVIPARPRRGKEIEELRELLRDIVV